MPIPTSHLVGLNVRAQLLPERCEGILAVPLHKRLVVGTYEVLEERGQLVRPHFLRPH